MTNAKDEFLSIIADYPSPVKCVTIEYMFTWGKHIQYYLPIGYTDEVMQLFLQNLDFEYDSGYGTQLLTGNIWFEDGTWADHREYDGSEWWEIQSAPTIPRECTFDMSNYIKRDDQKMIE